MSLAYFIAQGIAVASEVAGKCVQAPDRIGVSGGCVKLGEESCINTGGCMWRPKVDTYSRCSSCDQYVDPMCQIDCPRSMPPPTLDLGLGICTNALGFEKFAPICESIESGKECHSFGGCIYRFEQASTVERCEKCETNYDWMCDIDCPIDEEAYPETHTCFHAPGYENLGEICKNVADSEECRKINGCISRPPQASTYSRCSSCDKYVDPTCQIDCPQ